MRNVLNKSGSLIDQKKKSYNKKIAVPVKLSPYLSLKYWGDGHHLLFIEFADVFLDPAQVAAGDGAFRLGTDVVIFQGVGTFHVETVKKVGIVHCSIEDLENEGFPDRLLGVEFAEGVKDRVAELLRGKRLGNVIIRPESHHIARRPHRRIPGDHNDGEGGVVFAQPAPASITTARSIARDEIFCIQFLLNF